MGECRISNSAKENGFTPVRCFHELTKREKSSIRKEVKCICANYDEDYGCLLLDDDCYMFYVGFRESGLCRYFRDVVMPCSPRMLQLFRRQEHVFKTCGVCGKLLIASGNRKYCCGACAEAAKRKATAERVRRCRERKSRRDDLPCTIDECAVSDEPNAPSLTASSVDALGNGGKEPLSSSAFSGSRARAQPLASQERSVLPGES